MEQSVIDNIEELLEAARTRVYTAYDEGLKYLDEAMNLSRQYNYTSGIAWSTLRYGSYAYSRGDSLKAVALYKEALELFQEMQDFRGIARCHYSIATVYGLMSHFDLALNHYHQAIHLVRDYDTSYYSKLLNNLSNTYSELLQFDKALEVCQSAIAYMKVHEETALYMPYTSMGEIYLKMGQYKEALKYSELVLQTLEEQENLGYKAIANMSIAGAYKGMGHLDEALIVFNRAIKLMEAANNLQNISLVHRRIAEIYLQKKEYNYAFKHCQLAMTAALKKESELDESETYFLYADLYEALENYKKSYDCYKKGSILEKKIRSAYIEARYYALQIDQEEQTIDQYDDEIVNTLKRTLGELRSTYLNLNKAEKSQLTDAFVEAVVDTIDLRDTTTAGHSKRIAKYSLEMMKRLNEDQKDFRHIRFSENDMKEMYYAALLHDIGKLAIEEAILLKKRRLSEDRIEAINYKFIYMKSCLEIKSEQGIITEKEQWIYDRLDEDMTLVQSLVYAYSIKKDDLKRVMEIHDYEVEDCNGKIIKLLDAQELKHLTVEKGNLVQMEWEKMKTHATMTENFLKAIPWLSDLENVPMIASSHHEKLDGSGYPRGLAGDEITMQMRILAIVDIFEALTASDRPYKPALTILNAMAILHEEANDGKLDKRLVNFFEQEGICHICADELEEL